MIYRFLILVIFCISTSCDDILQDVDNCCHVVGNNSVLKTDKSTDNAQNIIFSWFAIANSEAVPVLKTEESLRPAQRTYDKRKLFTFNTLIVLFTNTFKHLSQKRLLLCHLNNIGGSLLHFLCKLSL